MTSASSLEPRPTRTSPPEENAPYRRCDPDMLLAMITLALSFLVLLGAWTSGGKPERAAAGGIAAWMAIDPIYRSVFATPQFGSVDWGLVLFDTGLFAWLLWIALRANRIWVLFAAAGALLPVLGHMAVLVSEEPVSRAYWAINQLPFFLVLLSLVLGTSEHRQRIAKFGVDADWSKLISEQSDQPDRRL